MPNKTQPLPLGVHKTEVTIRISKGFPLDLSPLLIHGPAIFFFCKEENSKYFGDEGYMVFIITPELCGYWLKDPRTKCKQ